MELDPLWLRWIWANNALGGYKASFLHCERPKGVLDLCVHRYFGDGSNSAAGGGKRESYRGGRMRLGEIEFAIIPSEECGVEELLLYSDDIPRLLLLGFDM